MKKPELLYVTDRQEWGAWLEKNSASKKAIWLGYYKKRTGKPTIPYEDAVEEAVCFGWSESNIARAKKMIAEGKITSVGLKLYENAMKACQIAPTTDKAKSPPADLKEALMKNQKAWKNFNALAPSYKLLYIYWVEDAKRFETRKIRIVKAVEAAAQNKKYPNM